MKSDKTVKTIVITIAIIFMLTPILFIYLVFFKLDVTQHIDPVYEEPFPFQISDENEIYDISLSGPHEEIDLFLFHYYRQKKISHLLFSVQGISRGIKFQEIEIQKIVVSNGSDTVEAFNDAFEIKFFHSYTIKTNGRTDAEINATTPGWILCNEGKDGREIRPANLNIGRFSYFISLPESIPVSSNVSLEFFFTYTNDESDTIMTKTINVKKFRYHFTSISIIEKFLSR